MPIYCTRWEHRVLYNNINKTHTHTHMQARTHTCTCMHARTHTHSWWGYRHGCEKQLETVTEQVGLEGGFKRGGRISGGVFEANCSKRWTMVISVIMYFVNFLSWFSCWKYYQFHFEKGGDKRVVIKAWISWAGDVGTTGYFDGMWAAVFILLYFYFYPLSLTSLAW